MEALSAPELLDFRDSLARRVSAGYRGLMASAAIVVLCGLLLAIGRPTLLRAYVIGTALLVGGCLVLFARVLLRESGAALADVDEAAEGPSDPACWSWRVPSKQWTAFVGDHNSQVLLRGLGWIAKGVAAGTLVYALAFVLAGEGSREGLVRFAAFGLCAGVALCAAELADRLPRGNEAACVFITRRGLCLGSRYYGISADISAIESVALACGDTGYELRLGLSTGFPWLHSQQLLAPVPDEITGEALVALQAIWQASHR